MTKIAINGFGRIGRLALRRLLETKTELEIVAINDLSENEEMAYALKYDSAHGRFPWTVEATEDNLIVDGKEIKVFAERDAANLPWGELGIDLVIECTGFYVSDVKAQAHLDAGAKKVIISAPAKGDLKTIVFGVNEDILNADDKIISVASCTTNSLAPLLNALHKEFGVKSGVMTTIHAYTATQAIVDAAGGRKSRAGAQNLAPASTGAAKAIGLVIPELDGKIDGQAVRVPTITGSLTQLYTVLNKEVTAEEVNAAVKKYESPQFVYNTDEIVSTDIITYPAGAIFDATQTKVVTGEDGVQIVNTASWYDNEYGFVANMVGAIEYIAKL